MSALAISLLLFAAACGIIIAQARPDARWPLAAAVLLVILLVSGINWPAEWGAPSAAAISLWTGAALMLAGIAGRTGGIRLRLRLGLGLLAVGALICGVALGAAQRQSGLVFALLPILSFLPAGWMQRRGLTLPILVLASWVAVSSLLSGALALQSPSGAAEDHRL